MEQAKIKVSDIKITDLRPRVKDPALVKLLPTRLFPQRIEFIVAGVSNAISNGLRRTICCELPVRALYCEYEDIKTDDPYIIGEMLIKRLQMIPIDQSTAHTAKFELFYTNATAATVDVKTADFRAARGGNSKLPFNETFAFCAINPGKSIRVSNISIREAYGHQAERGMYALAHHCVSLAVDQQPTDPYATAVAPATVASCSIANPQVWKIAFETNGTMDPKAIVSAACANIIGRIEAAGGLIGLVESSTSRGAGLSTHILAINGESDTIGNLFMRTINDLYPAIGYVGYSVSPTSRMVTLQIHCAEDIGEVISRAVKYIATAYKNIAQAFSA